MPFAFPENKEAPCRRHEARSTAAHEALSRYAQQYEARLRRMKRKRLKSLA
jgi:hypothetical protein